MNNLNVNNTFSSSNCCFTSSFAKRLFAGFVVFFLCQNSSAYASSKRECIESQMSTAGRVNGAFRGLSESGISEHGKWDLSCAGLSIGAEVDFFNEFADGIIFFGSYSYAIEEVVITLGVQHLNNYSSQIDSDSNEIFIEFEGRQEVFGFVPKIHFAKGLANNNGDYLSFRLGKDYYAKGLLVNPYAEYALGSYYSQNFKSNNLRFGVDVVRPVGEELYLSPNIALNIPLASVKEFNSSAKTSVEIGIALRKDF